uniref:Invertase inhibitor n=1 Tax=Coffea canephora TaxID=49390 RepID=A7IZL1_COFCA|nr:invertase inhibitor [Coffea canephora]
MRNFTSFMLLFPYALVVLTIVPPLISCDLISETCDQTPNDRLCVKILRKDNRSLDADVAGLALVAVEAVRDKANSTLQSIKELKRSNLTLANALMECQENYYVILRIDVPKAVGSMRENPRLAEHGMADAVIEAQGCEASLNKLEQSPLADVNAAVYDLSVVALSIIRIMLHRIYTVN